MNFFNLDTEFSLGLHAIQKFVQISLKGMKKILEENSMPDHVGKK